MNSLRQISRCGLTRHAKAIQRKVSLHPISPTSCRRFLASASSATPTSSSANAKKKDQPNFFLDNLGTIFLSTIGIIIASLVRSYFGGVNKNRERDMIEEESVLDPLEIDDLRVANENFTYKRFWQVYQDLKQQFPDGRATYSDFVRAVRLSLSQQKSEEPTIYLGHELDRVVLSSVRTDEPQPLLFWMTVLSLALNTTVPDRIQLLYQITKNESEDDRVTIHEVRQLVQYLQDTCQLPPDTQVLPTDQKYPTQQYKRGNARELVEWEGSERDPVDVDTLTNILRSKAVCAWGECFHKRKY